MKKLSECGFEVEEIESIQLLCKMFNAEKVMILDRVREVKES